MAGLRAFIEEWTSTLRPNWLCTWVRNLEPASEIVYKCSDYYAPETEGSVLWSDPEIGIDWPLQCQPVLSSKDATAPPLEKIENPFVYGVNS